ncbi:MAG: DUF1456 family protein [Cyclobacteriaceae bacterium]
MNNNVILRSLRYTFDYGDDRMIKIFELAELKVSRAEVSDWLKKEDDPDFKSINDLYLASFLNGMIIFHRGKKEGALTVPEKRLNNNLVLRKLKIALNLKNEDILDILESVDRHLSPHELSAFFRKPDQTQFRLCKDQIMRNFLHGLQLKYRS